MRFFRPWKLRNIDKSFRFNLLPFYPREGPGESDLPVASLPLAPD